MNFKASMMNQRKPSDNKNQGKTESISRHLAQSTHQRRNKNVKSPKKNQQFSKIIPSDVESQGLFTIDHDHKHPEIPEAVSQFQQTMYDVTERLGDKLTDITDLVTTLTDPNSDKNLASQAKDALSGFMSDFFSLADSSTHPVLNTVALISIGATSYMEYRNPSTFHKAQIVISVAIYLLTGGVKHMIQIFTYVSKLGLSLFFGKQEIVSQSGDSMSEDTFLGYFDLVSNCLFKSSSYRSTISVLNGLGTAHRAKEPLKALFQFLYDYMVDAINWIRKKFFGLANMEWAATNDTVVNDYLKHTRALLNKSKEGKLSNHQQNYDHIKEIIVKGEALFKSIPYSHQTSSTKTLLTKEIDDMKRIRDAMAATNFAYDGLRQEPVSIIFKGAPGVGKSVSLEYMINALVFEIFTDEQVEEFYKDRSQFTYVRNIEQVYFSGYNTKKFFTIIDDFGQVVDVAGGGDTEPMNLLRAHNVFTFKPHMDAIHEKGTTNFVSKFILMTTNRESFDFNSVVSQEAVKRRFDIMVTAAPKVEYCLFDKKSKTKDGVVTYFYQTTNISSDYRARRLDKSKLPESELVEFKGQTSLHPSILEYHVIDPITNEPSNHFGKPYYDFIGLVEIMKKTYRIKESRSNEYAASLKRGVEAELMRRKINRNLQEEKDKIVSQDGMEDTDMEDESIYETQSDVSYHKQGSTTLAKLDTTFSSTDYVDIDTDFLKEFSQEFYNECTAPLDNSTDYTVVDTTEYTKDEQTFMKLFTKRLEDKVYFTRYQAWLEELALESIIDEYAKSNYVRFLISWHRVRHTSERAGLGRSIFIPILSGNFTEASDLLFKYKILDVKIDEVFPTSHVVLPKVPASYTSKLGEIWEKIASTEREFSKQYPIYKLLKSVAGKLFGTAAFLCLGYGIVKMICNYFFPSVDIEAQSVGVAQRSMKKTGMRLKKTKSASSQMSAIADTSGYQILQSLSRKNMYQMSMATGPICPIDEVQGWTTLGFITFIRATVAVMPGHFSNNLEAKVCDNPEEFNRYIKFERYDKNKLLVAHHMKLSEFNDCPAYRYDEDIDLDLIVFPQGFFPLHMDITDRFPTADCFSKVRSFDVVIHSPGIDKKIEIAGKADVSFEQIVVPRKLSKQQVIDGEKPYMHVNSTFTYNFGTQTGHCGSLLFVGNKVFAKEKIWGIHVAGVTNQQKGYASTITQEIINSMFDDPETGIYVQNPWLKIKEEPLPSHLIESQMSSPIEGFELTHKSQYTVSLPSKTTIAESKIDVGFPRKTMPAKLRPFTNTDGQRVDPIAKSLEGYSIKSVNKLDNAILEEITQEYTEFLLKNSKPPEEGLNPFSFEDAVCGIENSTWDSINMKSSVGYPLKHQGLTKDKIFGKTAEIDLSTPEAISLRAEVDRIILNASNGVRCFHIFSEFAKDERRPIEKVMEGKTRNISGCPLALFIVMRMYFGPFANWIINNRISNSNTTGVNVYDHLEWTAIADKLARFKHLDPNCCSDADYKAFDKSHIPEISNQILVVIKNIMGVYSKEDHSITMDTLWLDITYSRHIVGSNIFVWFGSMSSGNALTPLINNMYSQLAFRYSFRMLDSERIYRFDVVVFMITHGDDLCYTAHPMIHSWFNDFTIAKAMKFLGMGYTSASKSSEVGTAYKTINDLTFLKRSWVRHPTNPVLYVAPMELYNVLEICAWTKREDNADADQIACDNVESVFRELSLHGKSTFDKYFKHLCLEKAIKYEATPGKSCWADYFKAISSSELIF